MSSGSLEESLQPFFTVQSVIVEPISTLSSMFLVYGMYTVVFGLCLHALLRRRRSGSGLYLVCTLSLFLVSNVYVVFMSWFLIRQTVIVFRAAKTRDFEPILEYWGQDLKKIATIIIANLSATLMNALADIMLIHRCYVLWGSNKIFLYIPGGMAFILNGISFATWLMRCIGLSNPNSMAYLYPIGEDIDRGNSMAISAFNGLLSLATAGRIWWVSREARQHMGMPTHERYKSIVVAILESGMLYPITLIASAVIPLVLDPLAHGTIPIDLGPVAYLMAGLAPTLIIVRVAYGGSVDSVQQMISIHFAERASGPGGINLAQETERIRATGLHSGDMEAHVEQVEIKTSEGLIG